MLFDLPKISIIIPVYNLEDCLQRCVNSILSNEEKNFELLLINDGSKDNSGVLCDEIAKSDPRIKVFHKANGGVGAARNLGIEHARGEWVSFIDGDDEISVDFLSIPEDMSNCDVIQKTRVYRKNNNPESDILYHVPNKVIDTEIDIFRFFIRKGNLEITEKLIKRKVIDEDRFATNIPIGEDGLFFYTIINKIHSWCFSPKGEYIYHIRPSSAMNSTQKHVRIKTWFNLCDKAFEIADTKKIKKICDNYIADKYVPAIFSKWDELEDTQKAKAIMILKDICWRNLSLLSFKHLMKFILIFCRFGIK